MGKVIGPISATTEDRHQAWFVLRELHDDIKYYKAHSEPERFQEALDKEQKFYSVFLEEYVAGSIS